MLPNSRWALHGAVGLACFHMSRLLGHLVEVPPATVSATHGSSKSFSESWRQARPLAIPLHRSLANLNDRCKVGQSKVVLSRWKARFWIPAENPRGENSSPEDYWTRDAIRDIAFYKVLSSSRRGKHFKLERCEVSSGSCACPGHDPRRHPGFNLPAGRSPSATSALPSSSTMLQPKGKVNG